MSCPMAFPGWQCCKFPRQHWRNFTWGILVPPSMEPCMGASGLDKSTSEQNIKSQFIKGLVPNIVMNYFQRWHPQLMNQVNINNVSAKLCPRYLTTNNIHQIREQVVFIGWKSPKLICYNMPSNRPSTSHNWPFVIPSPFPPKHPSSKPWFIMI
jgi:hypothetical protein